MQAEQQIPFKEGHRDQKQTRKAPEPSLAGQVCSLNSGINRTGFAASRSVAEDVGCEGQRALWGQAEGQPQQWGVVV